MTSGILAAIIAFLCWGFGNFFVQRSARRVGSLPALFAIVAARGRISFPFVRHDIPALFHDPYALTRGRLSVGITMVAAALSFEAFRVGKMSVMESILSFELVLTVLFGRAVLENA